MSGHWVFWIFVGTPAEVTEQLANLLVEISPRQIYTCNGEPLFKISTGGPVDGQVAVTVGAFLRAVTTPEMCPVDAMT